MFTVRSTFLVLSSCVAFALSGCSSSSADTTNPEPDAAATVSTFTEVYAIMGQHGCTECHSAETLEGGLNLNTQATAYASLVGQPPTTTTANTCATSASSDDLVTAGDPATSLLINKVSEANPVCGVRMPKGGAPLSADEIATFVSWVTGGAKDD